ncbi:hypothetical protein MBOU_54670 [Mycobacterium bourgelatii]|uniref:MalT-like TPR region domain-containing protein n=1 Tax=Mycobacterium bourgelatii TaxID=1273442 RepID=A0A7I9YXS1_MYCBU|nr:hypothetical protein MBOU_54670 [Mycobacterium bourgelatii]
MGDPTSARAAGEEGRDLADAIGDRPNSRWCRSFLAWAQLMQADVAGAIAAFQGVSAECEEEHDEFLLPLNLMGLSAALTYQGDVDAARAVGDRALETASRMDVYFQAMGQVASAVAALAAGDVNTAHEASERAWHYINLAQPQMAVAQRAFCSVEVALAEGDLGVGRDGGPTKLSRWRRDGTWQRHYWPEPASPSQRETERKRNVTPMMRWPAP